MDVVHPKHVHPLFSIIVFLVPYFHVVMFSIHIFHLGLFYITPTSGSFVFATEDGCSSETCIPLVFLSLYFLVPYFHVI